MGTEKKPANRPRPDDCQGGGDCRFFARIAAGTSAIVLASGGTYEVSFQVSGAATQQNSGHAIVIFAAGDVLTLRNHTSATAVTLQTLAGGTQTNVNASVLLRKLS